MCLTFKSNKGLFPGKFGNTVGETYNFKYILRQVILTYFVLKIYDHEAAVL